MCEVHTLNQRQHTAANAAWTSQATLARPCGGR